MATKIQHKQALKIINNFIYSLVEHGHFKGFSVSLSKRKIQLERLSGCGSLIIKDDAVHLYVGSDYAAFKRFMTEEQHFQHECNNLIFCDEEMEDAISKAFHLYQQFISDELNIGGWKRYE